MKSVLSIAGSDSSGGAGIQADIKTIQAMGLFAQTAVTAITAQNTLGVTAVHNVATDVVEAQIDAVFEDIRPDAVKIGMVSSAQIVHAIAESLKKHDAQLIVLDPVMVATSGSALAEGGAVDALRKELFPLATVVTPNLSEAQALCGFDIACSQDAQKAADYIAQWTPGAVLIKGGHGLAAPDRGADQIDEAADDLLRLPDGTFVWLKGQRVDNPNTHGTGCTLSSAIATGLAQGLDVKEAVAQAKEFITGALKAQMNLGKGSGPLDHMWAYR